MLRKDTRSDFLEFLLAIKVQKLLHWLLNFWLEGVLDQHINTNFIDSNGAPDLGYSVLADEFLYFSTQIIGYCLIVRILHQLLILLFWVLFLCELS